MAERCSNMERNGLLNQDFLRADNGTVLAYSEDIYAATVYIHTETAGTCIDNLRGTFPSINREEGRIRILIGVIVYLNSVRAVLHDTDTNRLII